MKSMEDLNKSYPTTEPPPYPGPPLVTSQPILSGSSGPHSTYTTYPSQSTVTVVHGAPVISGVQHVVLTNNMSPRPTPYTCPSCNIQIITRVEKKATIRTHLCAGLLCLIGCWPCVIIPYCTDGCGNTDHYCPNCSAYIGSYIG